jgi:tRNA(Ile)-lysidine synthase
LDSSSLLELRGGKNLLAFSAGVDSSALFFLLLKYDIKFDIALVNYGLREESMEEQRYAISLAEEYNLQTYIAEAPTFNSNFEKSARDFRYSFFNRIIEENGYKNLITAHQLNDQLEWFLMRLTKGAGVLELLGLESISKRDGYTLVRPILHHSKDELLDFLDRNSYRYFIDSSNSNPKYERNYFRKEFSNRLIDRYKDGIRRSLDYLREDRDTLMSGYREIFSYKKLYILELEEPQLKARVVDRYLKRLGYLLSSAQRDEVKSSSSIVIGGVFAIESVANRIYISPYIKKNMPKKYKEACRVAKIPPKIRGYCYSIDINPNMVLL